MEKSNLSEVKLIMLLQEVNNPDEINYFMNNYQNKIGISLKFIWKASMRWKNWSDVKGQYSMDFQGNCSEIETPSLNSQPRIRNYRRVWVIREILKMLNQYAVTIPRYQSISVTPTISRSWRNGEPPDITHGLSGNVFVNPTTSSSSPCPQGFNPWISDESEHTSPHLMSERQTPVQDQRRQWGPSVRNSSDHGGRSFFKELLGRPTTTVDSGSSFWLIPQSSNICLLEERFKTEVCICEQFPTEAILWNKEVEMVESVDDLKTSSSTRGIRMPDFEVLDARIASALNKIIHNSHFKRRISLQEEKAQKQDRFLCGRQIAFFDLRILRGYWVQRFCREFCRPFHKLFFGTMIFRNSIRNGTKFFCPWRKSQLMSSWKDCANWEHQSLRNSRPSWNLYEMENHQKRAGPDYHRLKMMVRRSIEHSLRMKNLEDKCTFRTKRRGQESESKKACEQSLGGSWQWKANGQSSKGDNCSFWHDEDERAKSTPPNISPRSSTQQSVKNSSGIKRLRGRSPSGKIARLPCKDFTRGTCTTPFCEKLHPPECFSTRPRMDADLGVKVLLCASPGWWTSD